MCGIVQVAINDQILDQLACLFHGVLLEELLAFGVIIDLLGFPARADGGLLFRRFFLLRLALQLVLEFLLVCRTHLSFVVCTIGGCCRRCLTAELHVIELHIYPDSILRSPAVKFVGIESFLHSEHCNVGLQGGLPQAIIVEVELVLCNVVEMLEGFVELFQRLAILPLPAIAAAHGGLVPHALHIMQIRSLRRVRLLRKEECLLHARLCVVHTEESPDGLRVQESVRQIHLPHLIEQFRRFLQIPSVPEDPRLACVDLDQCRCVVDGLVDVFERLVGVAVEVKVVCGHHVREEQTGGWLLIVVSGRGIALFNLWPKP
mmetsp:Transcript_23502/g.65851  ORF Transcript_23502/g.65851 Transcript_23502/m.65851 type:complete len:318 (-) Transcript_23502:1496-2449(-)